MPINLMDLYKDESEDKDNSQSTQETTESTLDSEVQTPQAESTVVQSSDNPEDNSIQDVSSAVLDSVVESQDNDSQNSDSSVEMSDEEKKEYGMTSIPKKIEVEDLEQKTSDFLKDPSLDNQVPEDLEYSSVFKSKTIVNYTLAISGFALLVVGVFSFLNSQSVDIQSSLDVISQTGKGSLADAPPPGMDMGVVISALTGTTEGQTSSDSGDTNVTGDASDDNAANVAGDSAGAGEQDSEDVLLDADDVLADDSVDDGSEPLDTQLNGDTSTDDSAVADDQDSQNDPFANISDDDFADLFGPLPGSESGFFGSQNSAGSSGESNPNDSDLNQLITDNDIQLDLLDDDSNVNNNGFLSNTNNTIITSGNIAGDSGPEIYLVLFMSLIFAGYLTTRTS